MSKFILIESSTALCSVALAVDGVVVRSRQSDAPKAHASKTAAFIKEILDSEGLGVKDCDAVCVSSGPGSYTGLRVGVSTAKGLCFAAGLPLISVSTLELLVDQAFDKKMLPQGCKYIVPMIDARRMEVYTALFSSTGERLSETEARVIETGAFGKELSEGAVLFIGDGAEKCKELLAHPNAYFVQCCPEADSLARAASLKFNEAQFEDIAYFEPFYLKQFTATVSKKKLF